MSATLKKAMAMAGVAALLLTANIPPAFPADGYVRQVYGQLRYSSENGGGAPPNGAIRFVAHLSHEAAGQLTQNSGGCGYLDGWWWVTVSNFAEHYGDSGLKSWHDEDTFTIAFSDTEYGGQGTYSFTLADHADDRGTITLSSGPTPPSPTPMPTATATPLETPVPPPPTQTPTALPNFLELDVAPDGDGNRQFYPGETLVLSWKVHPELYDYRNAPLAVYLGVVMSPAVEDRPGTVAEVFSGGPVFLFGPGIRGPHPYDPNYVCPSFTGVAFPPVVMEGELSFVVPGGVGRDLVFAAAFINTNTGEFINRDFPVEFSNLFNLLP